MRVLFEQAVPGILVHVQVREPPTYRWMDGCGDTATGTDVGTDIRTGVNTDTNTNIDTDRHAEA